MGQLQIGVHHHQYYRVYHCTCCDQGDRVASRASSVLREHGYLQPISTLLFCVNQVDIRFVRNPEFHHRTKHVDVQYYKIREEYQHGCV